jgi:hypothetical protein
MRKFLPFTLALLLAVSASAATLTGTVVNKTTGKPASGDEVALLALSSGMSEIGKTKTDASGKFSFPLDNDASPHLVRVTHQGVSYFPPGGPVRPGVSTVEIPVYDAASKIDNVSTTVTVLRVQADAGNLQLLQLVALNNQSNPPRALSGDRTYEFYLPEGAAIDQTIVQGPGGMPVQTASKSDGKNKYHFSYAIKPGETRFEIAFHLPYSGEATFTPKITDNIQHFVVMMPKSMKFEAKDASRFSPMTDDPTSTVQVATQVKPGTDVSFRVSGTGLLPDEQQGAGQQQAQAGSGGGMGTAGPDNRPGGGLGPPTDAPDPLHNFRWYILGGLAVVMVAGGVFIVSRSNQQASLSPSAVAAAAVQAAAPPVKKTAAAAANASVAPARAATQSKSSMILEALKEELFQLEVERQQGKISADEYEKAKAALNQTLSRALARQNS